MGGRYGVHSGSWHRTTACYACLGAHPYVAHKSNTGSHTLKAVRTVLPSARLLLLHRLVKDTTSWKNKQEVVESERAGAAQLVAGIAELAEEGLAAKLAQATADNEAAQVGKRVTVTHYQPASFLDVGPKAEWSGVMVLVQQRAGPLRVAENAWDKI